MKTLLLVIDLQQGFINEDTEYVVDKIKTLVSKNRYDKVLFTRFINSIDSNWYKKLNYKGCLTDESRKIVIDTNNYEVIDKNIYSVVNNNFLDYLRKNNISKIYLCGIDTECCILKNAVDLFEAGYEVYVLKDYCACMFGNGRHNNALEIIKRVIGIDSVI